MEYRPEEAKVTYFSKDRKEKKSYDATKWLAAMGSHVPERGQQSVRYYGAYANSTGAGSENAKHRGRTVGSTTCPVRIQHSFQYIIVLAFQSLWFFSKGFFLISCRQKGPSSALAVYRWAARAEPPTLFSFLETAVTGSTRSQRKTHLGDGKLRWAGGKGLRPL